MRSSQLRRVLLPLCASAALAIYLSWPLVTVMHSSFAGAADTLFSTWALAWQTHALATAPLDLPNGNIFWPDRGALFYGPTAIGALPWFAPFYLATGNPVLAVNVMMLLCLALTGASLHWVVRRWTGSDAAGFVAAAAYLTTPWVASFFVPLTPHYAALQFFPLIIFLASTPLARVRSMLALTILAALQCLTDLVYVAPAVLAPLGILALVRLSRPGTRAAGARLGAAVAGAALLVSPAAYGYVAVARRNPDLGAQTLWTSPILARTDLPWNLITPDRPATFRISVCVLVLAGMMLAVARRRGGTGLRQSRPWTSALFWCAVGFLLALGTPIVIGSLEVPGPQGLLARVLPMVERLRVPSRWGVASLMGSSLLAGLGFAQIAARIRLSVRSRATAAACVAALALIAVAAIRVDGGIVTTTSGTMNWMPWTPPPATILAAIARVPGPLVEVPNSPMPRATREVPSFIPSLQFASEQARAMLHSTYHWHPILNGYSSYFPEGFRRRLELANRLPRPRALEQIVKTTNLRLVWVHLEPLAPESRAIWLAHAAATPSGTGPRLRLLQQEANSLLFIIER